MRTQSNILKNGIIIGTLNLQNIFHLRTTNCSVHIESFLTMDGFYFRNNYSK